MSDSSGNKQFHSDRLELAFRRLVRARELLDEQRARVARREALGLETTQSKMLLQQMTQAAAGFQRHLKYVRSEIPLAFWIMPDQPLLSKHPVGRDVADA